MLAVVTFSTTNKAGKTEQIHSACRHFIYSIHNSHSWKFPEQLIHTLTTNAAETAPECANVNDSLVCDRAQQGQGRSL